MSSNVVKMSPDVVTCRQVSSCPKCYLKGITQELEPHHSTYHLHCPTHGWMLKTDIEAYWGAIKAFKSKVSKPSGATALQVTAKQTTSY